MTILIVDDNAGVRRVVREVLRGMDAVLHECASGDEVLEAVDAHRPDWVLMDVDMPGLDGISAARALLTRWPDVKVCLVSNYDAPGLRAMAADAGVRAYVLKDNLLEVRAVLGAERRAVPRVAPPGRPPGA
jgi:CheY-like chemotaxis protein